DVTLKNPRTKGPAAQSGATKQPAILPEQLHLLAAAEGHGLQVQPLDPRKARQEVVLRLPAEQVLRSRLIDLQGGPADGVRCRVIRVVQGGKDRMEVLGCVPPNFGFWPNVLTTDKTGRLTLRGLSANAQVVVEVDDDRFARTHLSLPADPKDPARETARVLNPSQLLEGVVVAPDTGKPLPGERLGIDSPRYHAFTVALAFPLTPYA